ncbi:MAG: Ig-like domain-containing protein [Syntrophales bacterium]
MTKSILIKAMFGRRLARLTILAMVLLLAPAGLFAQGQTIAVDDFAITPPNTPVTIDVIANDTAGNGTWDLTKITNTNPKNGTVNNPKDGTFIYTPNTDFSSPVPDTFTYTVCDTDDTPDLCATATVSIIVANEVSLNVITRKLNVKKMGVLPVEIRSSEDFDVTTIDPESLKLQGVSPIRWNLTGRKLTLKFHAQQIVSSLGPVNDRDVVVLLLTGLDANGVAIAGEDPVIIINKGNKGKHNK